MPVSLLWVLAQGDKRDLRDRRDVKDKREVAISVAGHSEKKLTHNKIATAALS